MKELKDYLHLYLGCEVEYNGEIWKLKSVEIGINGNRCGKLTRKREERQTYDIENYELRNGVIPFKLILFDILKIGYDEYKEVDNLEGNADTSNYKPGVMSLPQNVRRYFITSSAVKTIEAAKRRWDLFGLIEAGLAIDATRYADKRIATQR